MPSHPAESSQKVISPDTPVSISQENANSNGGEDSPPFSMNLAFLWLGQFVSNLGDWCLWVAIPVAVYNSTGSKVDLAFTMFTEGLPFLIFSPIAGVLVDRFDKKRTMVAADIGRALLVLLLAIPQGHIQLWTYYAVLFCSSALSAFFMPARISVMNQVVPRRELMRVNAILSTSLQISEAIGPAAAGIILALFLQRGAFLADAITFLLSAACIQGLSLTFGPNINRSALTLKNCIQDLREGLKILFHTPTLRGMLVSWNVGYLSAAVFNSMEYAFAHDVLHLRPERYGFMLSFMGIGFLTGGALLATVLHKLKPTTLIVTGLLASAIAALIIAISHSMASACAGMFIFGFGGLIVNVPAQTLVQRCVPREMLGRFSGAFSMVARIAQIIGSASAGFLASALTLPHTYLLVMTLYFVSAFLASMLLSEPPDETIAVLPITSQ